MFVHAACIQIESEATGDDLAHALRSLTAGGPFAVSGIEHVRPGRHRCHFGLAKPGLAVGYRSVIELQHRIDREFDIVSVDHHATHFSTKEEVLL
jgi:hypothetical protein